VRRVGDSVGVRLELERETLRNIKVPEQTYLQVDKSRTPQNVAGKKTAGPRQLDPAEML